MDGVIIFSGDPSVESVICIIQLYELATACIIMLSHHVCGRDIFLLYNGSKSYLKKFQYKAPGNYSYYQCLQDAFPDEIQVYQKTDESKL